MNFSYICATVGLTKINFRSNKPYSFGVIQQICECNVFYDLSLISN